MIRRSSISMIVPGLALGIFLFGAPIGCDKGDTEEAIAAPGQGVPAPELTTLPPGDFTFSTKDKLATSATGQEVNLGDKKKPQATSEPEKTITKADQKELDKKFQDENNFKGEVVVVADPPRLELGEIPTGEKRTGIITLRNTGDSSKTLLKCKTSCGCTTTNCKEGLVINPGETTDVSITLDGGNAARQLTKTVTFLIAEHPPLQVQISGQAISYVVVSPARLDPEEHPDGILTLTALDDKPFIIQNMYPPIIEEFSKEPAVEHVLHIDWEKMREGGFRQRKLLFRLDHPSCSQVYGLLSINAIRQDIPTAEVVNAKTPPKRSVSDTRFDELLRDGNTDDAMAMIENGHAVPNIADSSQQTPLIKAARWGDPVVIQELLDRSGRIDARDRLGRDPLMYACQSKNLAAVRLLLDAGSDINATDQLGNTALCWGAGFGTGEIVTELIEAGSRIDVRPGLIGFTPLIWASGFGEPGAVSALLEANANIEAADSLQGATPIMHASRTNMHENASLLIAAGANLEARDTEGSTALLMAARNAGADADMIRLLAAAGADLQAQDSSGQGLEDLARARTDLRASAVVEAIAELLGPGGEAPVE